VAVKKEQPEATPLKSELPSPWRTWSDPQGNKIEAAICSLYGNILTVQMLLMNLEPADRAFAADYMKRVRANSFADDYVKKAAYQIDYLIGSTLVANKQKFNGNATEEHYVRRI
jgi:hypothetical protein